LYENYVDSNYAPVLSRKYYDGLKETCPEYFKEVEQDVVAEEDPAGGNL
jgi:hypothetical protein